MKNKNNDAGFVLPLVLVVALICSTLLLTMSMRISAKASSYERAQIYARFNLVERQNLAQLVIFLEEIAETSKMTEISTNFAEMTVYNSIIVRENYVEITYEIVWESYRRRRRIRWQNEMFFSY